MQSSINLSYEDVFQVIYVRTGLTKVLLAMIFLSVLLVYIKQHILYHHRYWWFNSNSKNTISPSIDQLSVLKHMVFMRVRVSDSQGYG